MKLIALATLLAASPVVAFAHGPTPPAQHGGTVAEASDEHWVELVFSGSRITVYVSSEENKPLPSKGLGGKATVLAGGKSQQVALSPAEANSLTGQLDPAPTGKVTTVVSLTIDGKPAQVRYTATQ